jgi:N-acyl homoserine lactone hydrolase
MMEGTPDANADSKLPDPIKAGVAEKPFRLDCGRSVANDESVWTPSENVGRRVEASLKENHDASQRLPAGWR